MRRSRGPNAGGRGLMRPIARVQIYDEAMPANPDAPIGDAVLLVELRVGTTVSTIKTGGTARWARAFFDDGSPAVDLSVGDPIRNPGAAFLLNTIELVPGATMAWSMTRRDL